MLNLAIIIGLTFTLACQPERSENRLAIVDQTSATLNSEAGGTVELGDVSVTAPKGLVDTDYKISIKRTMASPDVADGAFLGGSNYIIEVLGLNGATLSPDDLDDVLTFAAKHKIDNGLEDIMALVINNYSKAPALWERFYVLYPDLEVSTGLQLQDYA